MTRYRERREAGEYAPEAQPEAEDDLGAMTKDELLDEAAIRGVDVPAGATKAQIREAIEGG